MKAMAAALLCVAALSVATKASADPPGGGWCGPKVCGGGGGEPAPLPGDGGATTSPLFWRRTLGMDPVACASVPDAAQWQDRLIDSRSGQTIARRYQCVTPGEPEPPLPPVPPSPYEAWGFAPIPAPEVNINPHGDGLVGLPTWLWYDQETARELVVDAPPFWTLTITVGVVGYEWDMGNGDIVYSTEPGTEEDPSATYVYQHDCQCEVVATVVWGGSYVVTGPGFEPFTVDIGTRRFAGPPRPYYVPEVQ